MLQKHGEDNGINFFRFVINPHSYGQTIENIFYLSFLCALRPCFVSSEAY